MSDKGLDAVLDEMLGKALDETLAKVSHWSLSVKFQLNQRHFSRIKTDLVGGLDLMEPESSIFQNQDHTASGYRCKFSDLALVLLLS